MSRANFYRGTSLEQDGRFKNKEKLTLQNKQFPCEYEIKIDMKKVKII
jgi:serine/arginine repetitive matrix protein 1